MLACMSNLAILADAGDANTQQFNAIFYATIATIIPVLFVAAALQQDMFVKLIEISRNAYHRTGFRAFIIHLATAFVPLIILIYGIIGEIVVLVDLYRQRTIGLAGPFNGAEGPLIAAAALTVAAGLGPAAKFGTFLYQVYGPSQARKSVAGTAEEAPRGHATPGEPPPPEGGKSGGDQKRQS
jgi:hypothetical protein